MRRLIALLTLTALLLAACGGAPTNTALPTRTGEAVATQNLSASPNPTLATASPLPATASPLPASPLPATALPTLATRTGEAVATKDPSGSPNPTLATASPLPATALPTLATRTGEAVATQNLSASPNPTLATASPLPATASPLPATALPTLPATRTGDPTWSPVPAASQQPAAATASPLPATASPLPATASPLPATALILFLRSGALWAHALNGGAERKVADDVREFALASDGVTLALVRGREQTDIWLASLAAPGEPRRLTNDPRNEAGLGWSPYGALVFGSSTAPLNRVRDQQAWSVWCGQSEVRIIEEETPNARLIAPGCDPAFSPDGKRIAFATPPSAPQAGYGADLRVKNSIRLVNAAGKNGWDFAKATGGEGGLLVHSPSWSADGKQVSYHRFAGYQALVDIALSEISGSFQGKGKPYGVGAGWQWPAWFTPDGTRVAVTQYNYSDARGFGGYDEWSVSVVTLGTSSSVDMPGGPLMVQGKQLARLFRAQAAAWSPDGTQLAVVLPAKWQPNLPDNEPFGKVGPGEVWRWTPGSAPSERLVENVDFGTPLLWVK